MTGPIKKARKEREIDQLAFNVLNSFRHQGAMQWTDWYETTRARRGKPGLGPGTFSEMVKRLTAKGRVQVDRDGCYQVVFDGPDDTEKSAGVDTERFSEVLGEGRNGKALQQLMDTEVRSRNR
jgi:hypothetical protein